MQGSVLDDSMIPVRLHLKAGVPESKDINGEFIFIDQGRDLEIRWNGSILTNRREGDVMRGRGNYTKFTVTSEYDQIVDLVVGFGDYSRLIVSGELNVSAYVKTRGRGVAKSLPFALTKRVFVDKAQVFSTTRGSTIIESEFINNAGPQYFNGAVACWRERYYGMNKTHINEMNEADGTVTQVAALDWSNAANYNSTTQVHSMAITAAGEIYFRVTNNLYKTSFGGVVENVSPIPIDNAGSNYPLWCLGDYIYAPACNDDDGRAWYFCRYNIKTGVWSNIKLSDDAPMHGSATYDFVYDQSNGLILSGLGGFDIEITAEGKFVEQYGLIDSRKLPSDSNGQMSVTRDGVKAIKGSGNKLTIMNARTADYYGSIYTQDGADAATKREIYLTEPASFVDIGADTLIIGTVAKWLIETLAPSDGYLDYLVSVQCDDGVITRKVSAGTETFSYRDMGDSFAVKSGTDVTIEMLPEFFD